MGIDIGSALVVGLPFYEVVGDYNEYIKVYEGELEKVMPYLGAESKDCLLAYSLYGKNRAYQVIPDNIYEMIECLKDKFKLTTGKDARVYVSPVVWGNWGGKEVFGK